MKKGGHISDRLLFYSTIVISSIKCPAPANLSMMKST